MPRQQLLDVEVRDGVARRLGVERLPERVVPVAADRRLDRPSPGARPADDEREVLARQPAPAHELAQTAVRLGRAGDDEQARGVAVEAMDDARAVRLLPARDVVAEQPVYERPACMAGRGMDDDPRGLVDDEEVLVL